MKIYLDNCCWNRPYDGYTDEDSVAEVAAIKMIIAMSAEAGFTVFSSFAVTDEIDAMRESKPRKWANVRGFYNDTKTTYVKPTPDTIARAKSFFEATKLREYDCLHLAIAEAVGADVLLTTDKRFINMCAKMKLSIDVMNPINFLPEVEEWAQ